jgi:hypothetical protein
VSRPFKAFTISPGGRHLQAPSRLKLPLPWLVAGQQETTLSSDMTSTTGTR